MTIGHLLTKSTTLWTYDANYLGKICIKNPGTFLMVVSTGDTRMGKICQGRITSLLCCIARLHSPS